MINDVFEDTDSDTLERCKEFIDSNKNDELVLSALLGQDKDKELVYSSESDIENYDVYEDDLSGIENFEELSDGTDIDMLIIVHVYEGFPSRKTNQKMH